jgi:hypothetical protein
VALDTVEGLKSAAQKQSLIEVTLAGPNGEARSVRLDGADVSAAVSAVLAQAAADGQRVLAINTVRPTLEDVFVQLTGLSGEVMLVEKGGR